MNSSISFSSPIFLLSHLSTSAFLLLAYTQINAQTPPNALFNTVLGEEKVLFILVNYPDDPNVVMTFEEALDHATNVETIMEVNSFGLHTFNIDVTPVLTMPQPKSFYQLEDNKWSVKLRADALVAAEQAGFNIDNYEREGIYSVKI